jgi:hypothetical protein
MATNNFKVKFGKSKDQMSIRVWYNGGDSITGSSSLTAHVYADESETPTNTYTLATVELNALKSGSVALPTALLTGSQIGDNWYWVVFRQGSDYESEKAGFGMTLESTGEVYSRLDAIDIEYHDFRIDEVLHTAHMVLSEMNAMESVEATYQDRGDFDKRLETLKQILKY